MFAICSLMLNGMGQMKRREAREADTRANQYIGSVTLDQVRKAGIKMLNVACNHCQRNGRYRVAGLVDRYGEYVVLPNLKNIIAADCPRQRAHSIYDKCGVFFPGPLPGQPLDPHS